MRDDDVVLGVEVDGDARAYPWWIMDNHHAANDIVGGVPMLIVLCEVCSSAVALDPIIEGERFIFQAAYKWNGTFALEDRQTGSIWSAYVGSIRGPMEGRKLPWLPLMQVEWATWLQEHPDSLVLPPELGERGGHGSRDRIGSPRIGSGMRRSIIHWDERLPHNELVLGIRGDIARLYLLNELRERRVINDGAGGVPIVVLADGAKGSYGALAFSRVVDGGKLTFDIADGRIVDRETASTWTARGVATAGPLAGHSLRFVESHVSQFYIWATSFPGVEIRRVASIPPA